MNNFGCPCDPSFRRKQQPITLSSKKRSKVEYCGLCGAVVNDE